MSTSNHFYDRSGAESFFKNEAIQSCEKSADKLRSHREYHHPPGQSSQSSSHFCNKKEETPTWESMSSCDSSSSPSVSTFSKKPHDIASSSYGSSSSSSSSSSSYLLPSPAHIISSIADSPTTYGSFEKSHDISKLVNGGDTPFASSKPTYDYPSTPSFSNHGHLAQTYQDHSLLPPKLDTAHAFIKAPMLTPESPPNNTFNEFPSFSSPPPSYLSHSLYKNEALPKFESTTPLMQVGKGSPFSTTASFLDTNTTELGPSLPSYSSLYSISSSTKTLGATSPPMSSSELGIHSPAPPHLRRSNSTSFYFKDHSHVTGSQKYPQDSLLSYKLSSSSFPSSKTHLNAFKGMHDPLKHGNLSSIPLNDETMYASKKLKRSLSMDTKEFQMKHPHPSLAPNMTEKIYNEKTPFKPSICTSYSSLSSHSPSSNIHGNLVHPSILKLDSCPNDPTLFQNEPSSETVTILKPFDLHSQCKEVPNRSFNTTTLSSQGAEIKNLSFFDEKSSKYNTSDPMDFKVTAPAAFPTEQVCSSHSQAYLLSPNITQSVTTTFTTAEDKTKFKQFSSSTSSLSSDSPCHQAQQNYSFASSFNSPFHTSSSSSSSSSSSASQCPPILLSSSQYTLPSTIAPQDIVHSFDSSSNVFVDSSLSYPQNESLFFVSNSTSSSPASSSSSSSSSIASAKTSGSFASHRSSVSNMNPNIPERLFLTSESNDTTRKPTIWNVSPSALTAISTLNNTSDPSSSSSRSCSKPSTTHLSSNAFFTLPPVELSQAVKPIPSNCLAMDPSMHLMSGSTRSTSYANAFLSPASPHFTSLSPWELAAPPFSSDRVTTHIKMLNHEARTSSTKSDTLSSFDPCLHSVSGNPNTCFMGQSDSTTEVTSSFPDLLSPINIRQQPFSTCTTPPPSSGFKTPLYPTSMTKENVSTPLLFFNESSSPIPEFSSTSVTKNESTVALRNVNVTPSSSRHPSNTSAFPNIRNSYHNASNATSNESASTSSITSSTSLTMPTNAKALTSMPSVLPDLPYTIRPSCSVQLLGRNHVSHYLTSSQIQSLLVKYLMHCSGQPSCHTHGCWHNYIYTESAPEQVSASDVEAASERQIARWGQCKITIYTPKVAQKSYGTEKRFLCPPPLISILGHPFFPNLHSSSTHPTSSSSSSSTSSSFTMSASLSSSATSNSLPTTVTASNPRRGKPGLPNWMASPPLSSLPLISLRLSDTDQCVQSERGECINLSDASWKTPVRLKCSPAHPCSSHVSVGHCKTMGYPPSSSSTSSMHHREAFSSTHFSCSRFTSEPSFSATLKKEEAFVGIDKYCGENHCGDQVIERWIFKQIWVSDSERKKSFECVFKIPHPHFTVRSKPIKVISKPSKKKINSANSSNSMLGAIHSNSTVSLFNRIRSQTVSTKYLTVGSTLVVPSSVFGREPSYTDPINKTFLGEVSLDADLFTSNIVTHVFPGAVNPEQVQFLLSTSSWSNFQIQLVDEYETGSEFLTLPSVQCTCTHCTLVSSQQHSEGKAFVDKVLCYNQTVILVDPITGLKSKKLILRKVEKSTMAVIGEGKFSLDIATTSATSSSMTPSSSYKLQPNLDSEVNRFDFHSQADILKKLRSAKDPITVGHLKYRMEPLASHPWISHLHSTGHLNSVQRKSGSLSQDNSKNNTHVLSSSTISNSMTTATSSFFPSKSLNSPSDYFHDLDSPFSGLSAPIESSFPKSSLYFNSSPSLSSSSSSHSNLSTSRSHYGIALAANEEVDLPFPSHYSFPSSSHSSLPSIGSTSYSTCKTSTPSSYSQSEFSNLNATLATSSSLPSQSVEPTTIATNGSNCIPKQEPLLQLHKLCFQIKDIPYPGGFLSLVENRVGLYFPSRNDVKFCANKEEPKKVSTCHSNSKVHPSSSSTSSLGSTSTFNLRSVNQKNNLSSSTSSSSFSSTSVNEVEGTLMVDVTEMAVWTIVGTEKQEYTMYLPQVPPSLPEMPQITSLTLSLSTRKPGPEAAILSLTGVHLYPGLSLYLSDVHCPTEWHSNVHGHVTLPSEPVLFRSLFGESINDGSELSLLSHYTHFIVRHDTLIRKDRLVCSETMNDTWDPCQPPSLLLPLVLVDTTGVIYETGWEYFLRLDEKILGNGNIVVME